MFEENNIKPRLPFDEKKNDFDLQLFCRKSKKEGYVTIYCHILVYEKRTKSPFSTKITIDKTLWNNKAYSILGNMHNVENDKLLRLKQDIYYIYLEQRNKKLPHDAETIKKIYCTPHNPKDSRISTIVDLHFAKYKKNERYTEGTKKRVSRYIKRIKDFFKDTLATDLQETNIDNFYVYLTQKHGNAHNTAIRAIEFLKAALHTGYLKAHLPFTPCHDYEVKRKRTNKKTYLTKAELEKLENTKFLNKNLERIRDVFVFCCYTGLDFGDSKTFKANWVKQSIKVEYIDYHRAKTDFKGLIPFYPKAKEIAIKHDFKLPVFSNQYHNKLIKEACYLAGIDQEKANRISTHSARVTAGMVWLNEGIRIEVVSKMLGHASIQTTQRYYADIELETVLREARKFG